MNSLSWMIYLADVVGSVKEITAVALIVGAFIIGLALLMSPLIMDALDIELAAAKKAAKPVLATMAVLGVIYAVTPSTNTIYAIAASEMGEEVLKSSTATKAQKALDAWLDKQIGEQEKAK